LLIHANRLKLCEPKRYQLFSKYANDIKTIIDTARTKNDDTIVNTPFLTYKTTVTDKSHIATATSHANESRTLVSPGANARERKTVSEPTTAAANTAKSSATRQMHEIQRLASKLSSRKSIQLEFLLDCLVERKATALALTQLLL